MKEFLLKCQTPNWMIFLIWTLSLMLVGVTKWLTVCAEAMAQAQREIATIRADGSEEK